MKKRRLYITLFLLCFFIFEILATMYRSYIYNNNINDYGLADMYPNIGAVIIASFLFMGYKQYKEYKDELIIIFSVVIGFILYELLQITPLIGVFDWKDIMGTVIGGCLTFLIHKLINNYEVKKHNNDC